jgi:16S rRNA G966 N2-methylase RsmD
MSKELTAALRVVERELGVKIRKRKLSDLKPDPQNTRKHNDRNRGIIVESMKEVGAARSVVLDANDVIRAGNATVSVAPSAGITEGIEIETGGDRLLIHKRGDLIDERKAIRLSVADNASTDASAWDVETLTFHMRGDETLFSGILDDDDDVLHKIRKAMAEESEKKDQEFIPPEPGKAVSKRGDVWICGRHRVMCGSATDVKDVDKLLDGKKAHFAYCDPPYGIAIVQRNQIGGGGAFGGKKNEIRGAAVIDAVKYAPVIGDESTATAISAYHICAEKKIAKMVWWGGNHYASALPDASCWIVWDKVNGENNFADAELAWTNFKTAVRICRHQWNGLLKESERGEKRVHPTQKPVALAVWCLEKYGEGGENVLDLFGGSGSTLLACEATQRSAFIMELSEPYVDIIVARWEHATSKKAVRLPRSR